MCVHLQGRGQGAVSKLRGRLLRGKMSRGALEEFLFG